MSEIEDDPQEPPIWATEKPFDVVLLHNTLFCLRWTGSYFYRIKKRLDWIRRLNCLKIAIPQDEGDHAELLDEWLFDWGISAIFSIHQPEGTGPLYPVMRDKAKFYGVLPGYIDDEIASDVAQKILPISKRNVDIVYRARRLPYWFGVAGQIKHQIADVVSSRGRIQGLRCDISTQPEDVILGNSWLEFLASSRGVIGSEGGSNVIDWRGEVQTQINAFLEGQPDLTYEEISAKMPQDWDSYTFLTITPRNFEAVITKTCQLLIEGQYKGILEPNVHYIPLKKDFSNLDDALEMLKDDNLVESIVEQAYQDIYINGQYTYRRLAALIEQAIYDPALPYSFGDQMKQIAEIDNPSAILERQLVAERHAKELLNAKLKISEHQNLQLQQENSQLRNVISSPVVRWGLRLLKKPLLSSGLVAAMMGIVILLGIAFSVLYTMFLN
ncbi:MAG: hypothetical protein HND51_02110 [Chloroflexi bacterium]|nr:hypothetical protein [Chloroflexota bacterium]